MSAHFIGRNKKNDLCKCPKQTFLNQAQAKNVAANTISQKKETSMNNLAPFLAQGRNYL